MTALRRGLAAVGALAIAVAVYWPALDGWFVGDDLENVLGGRYGGPFTTQASHGVRNFRPLHLWSLGWNHRLGGLDPIGYHLVSLVLHVGAALLVAAVVREVWHRLDDSPSSQSAGGSLGAAIAGGLFLVAPNHVEAVAWIDGRSDLAATVLLLAALLCALRGRPAAPDATGSVRRQAASVALYALSFGWKEIGITFPVVVGAAILAVDRDRRLRRAVIAASPYALVTGAYLVVRRLQLGALVDGGIADASGVTTPVRTLRGGAALAIRSVVPALPPAGWAILAAIVGLLAVRAAVAGRSGRPRRGPSAPARASLAFAGSAVVVLAPVAHLGAAATSPAGERLVYLSSALVAVGIGILLAATRAPDRRVAAASAVIGLVAATALVAGNLRWARAAAVAEATASDLAALPVDRPVHLVGLADTSDGVYVMRNATAPTLVLLDGWANPPPVDELAVVAMHSDAAPRIRATRLGPARWRFELIGPATFSDVADGRSGWTVAGATVERRDRRVVDVTWTREPPTVAYYSSGELVVLDVGSPEP